MKKILTLIVAAAALSAGAAVAAQPAVTPASNVLICRWEATQQSGIPVRICLTRRQWEHRTLNTQQWIREYQARSYVTK